VPTLHQRRRLGDVLLDRGLLTALQLKEALDSQQNLIGVHRKRLGKLLVDMGFLTERQVAESLAELLSLDLLDSSDLLVPLEVARLLPRQVAERAQVLVLGHSSEGLRIATADPTNVVALDDVRAYTGSQSLTLVVATSTMIQEQIARIWSLREDAKSMPDEDDEIETDVLTDEEEMLLNSDQAPTVKLVNQILAEAVRVGASDIHVEQQVDGIWIRHRIDGVLRDVTRIPKAGAASLISRLKIVSGMDIAQRRLPQDGRMKITANGVAVDARVSTLPSINGEKVVVRLLPEAEEITPLDKLGLEPPQLEALVTAATASQGLVLITGPTGSGKTNTLYSLLAEVATRDKNVITLEDPVEIQLPGITQVDQRACRHDIRSRLALDAAPRPRRHLGGRGPRHRNCAPCTGSVTDRPPRHVDVAHQQRVCGRHATRRHGRRALSRGVVAHAGRRATAGTTPVPDMRRALQAFP
jgi:type IV pilus assembly protein PilB